jgi:hypothetical protein
MFIASSVFPSSVEKVADGSVAKRIFVLSQRFVVIFASRVILAA